MSGNSSKSSYMDQDFSDYKIDQYLNQNYKNLTLCQIQAKIFILEQQYEEVDNYFNNSEQKDYYMNSEGYSSSQQDNQIQQKNDNSEIQKISHKSKRITKHWSKQEDEQLKINHKKYKGNWNQVSKIMSNRNKSQCAQRWRRINPGKKVKMQWSYQEDQQLLQLINQYGKNWKFISQNMSNRTAKQVRERYINRLDDEINHGKWTEQEDEIILENYQKIGPKWSQISKELVGRPENWVKNRFYCHLQKQFPLIEDSQSESKQSLQIVVQKEQIFNTDNTIKSSVDQQQLANFDQIQKQQISKINQHNNDQIATSKQDLKLNISNFISFEQKYEIDFYEEQKTMSCNKFVTPIKISCQQVFTFSAENSPIKQQDESYLQNFGFIQKEQNKFLFEMEINENKNTESTSIEQEEKQDNNNDQQNQIQAKFRIQEVQSQIVNLDFNNVDNIELSLKIKQELQQKLQQIDSIIEKQSLSQTK